MTILLTANIGGIDEQKLIPEQSVPHESLYFTESPVEANNRIKALYYKTQPHKVTDSDIVIWVDAKIQILSSDFVQQCLDALGGNPIAILKHHERDCIYKEVDHIEHCIKKGNQYLSTRYANRPIRAEVEYYRSKGYPANNGLNDCCIIAYRPKAIEEILYYWWQLCQEDAFDQIAIQYLCWLAGIKIQPIIFKPDSFKDIPHIKLQ
jgi:hypothetical protein